MLVDIKGIPEVNQLSYNAAQGLTLGAAVPCYRIYEHQEIAATYPGLIDAVSLVGGTAIQGERRWAAICATPLRRPIYSSLIVHSAMRHRWPQWQARDSGGAVLHRPRTHRPTTWRIPRGAPHAIAPASFGAQYARSSRAMRWTLPWWESVPR